MLQILTVVNNFDNSNSDIFCNLLSSVKRMAKHLKTPNNSWKPMSVNERNQIRFNLDKVTHLKQRRNSLVHVYESSEIHASIDTLMSGGNKVIFVEFETSVPSPDSIENLKKISDNFKTLIELNEYTGNKFDYVFSKDGDRT